MKLNVKPISLSKEILILGVQIGSHAARNVACIQRITPLPDSKGCAVLYNPTSVSLDSVVAVSSSILAYSRSNPTPAVDGNRAIPCTQG